MEKIGSILITGGLGFVGSNTVIEIIQNTHLKITLIDDCSNSYKDVLERIKLIISQNCNPEEYQKRIQFYQGSVLDLAFLSKLFELKQSINEPLQCIMHFAAKKSVGESILHPLAYYENNFVGSMNLFKMMEKYRNCNKFIFSSTAAVYGQKDNCIETDIKNPMNPYAESKSCVEMLMASLAKVHPNWQMISLRYFNPVGAHPSGLLGDDPSEYPTNLIPCIQQYLLGKRPKFQIFGNDYNTPDGTGVRDFIHINDLAKAHIKAIHRLAKIDAGIEIYNLGTGKGSSVMEVVLGFEKVLGRPINYTISKRRQADLPQLVANVEKANQILGWTACKSILDVCRDCICFLEKRYGFGG